MNNDDRERRLQVWEALSDLFLDTEISDHTYQYIAKKVLESGFTPSEIQLILWHEVFPVLESNFSSPAGVCWGWDREWLEKHIRPATNLGPITGDPGAINEITRCWKKVSRYLPPAYA